MDENEVKPEKQGIVAETLTNIQAAGLYTVAVWSLGILAGGIALLGSLAPFFGASIPDQAWTLAQGALIGLVGLLGGKAANQ